MKPVNGSGVDSEICRRLLRTKQPIITLRRISRNIYLLTTDIPNSDDFIFLSVFFSTFIGIYGTRWEIVV